MSITPHEQPVSEEPAAAPSAEQQAPRFGLLANGSSSQWDVAVDESLDQEGEWLLELDGPSTYLAFRIRNLGVIGRIIDFFQRHLSRPVGGKQPKWSQQDDAILLGTLGQANVSLLWDNEDVPRCFILVDPEGVGAIRLSIQRDDIEMLLEALHQVATDLSDETR